MSKGLFAKNSVGKKIVTCTHCGFQTTWGNYVDWDSKFECRLCSPTKEARMIHNVHEFHPGNSDGTCTYCNRLNPDNKTCFNNIAGFIQFGCETGRISCKEPNKSNVPVHEQRIEINWKDWTSKDIEKSKPKYVKVAKQPTSVTSAKDVHTEHCCSIHGCKYGEDSDCTVVRYGAPQSFPCEYCQEAIGTDEPHYATSGWNIWKVDKGQEKEDLLKKLKKFLLACEHFDGEHVYDFADETMAWAHELRVELDKIFAEQLGEGNG